MSSQDIVWAPLHKIVELTSTESISPAEVAEIFLERIRELDPKIKAFITVNERAPEEAKALGRPEGKPLYGVPIAVKDNQETRGLRTTYGSRLFENNVPQEDAVIVERIKRAGAIVLGKTNLPEFALMPFTDNNLVGPTRNPWDLSRTAGGSSGGSGAAVAAGLAPAALGNDAGGSIRIPASFCGVYGFKPSYGRIPHHPRAINVFIGLHTEGFLTRTVRDAAILMDVTAGPDLRDFESLPREVSSFTEALEDGIEGARIAFSIDLGYAAVDEEVERVVREAVKAFEKAGAEVEEVQLKLPDVGQLLVAKTLSEVLAAMRERMDEWRNVAYPMYLALLETAEAVKGVDYAMAQAAREALWNALRGVFREYDFLVTPTTAVPPFKIEDIPGPTRIAGRDVEPIIGWIPFTYPFNFTKQPAASLPAGLTRDRLPVGLQIVGRPLDDLGVLRASAAYERVRPWSDWRPPIK